jgi:hypothetical protein
MMAGRQKLKVSFSGKNQGFGGFRIRDRSVARTIAGPKDAWRPLEK